MKKYTFLGVNKFNRCCILYCIVPFDSLIADEIEASDFIHSSTNWCGCDDVDRALKIINKVPTGKKIELPKPIVYNGSDYDCGHNYSWRFEVNEIWELKRYYNKKKDG